MDEILFEVLKAVVIISVMVIVRYVVPWIKSHTAVTKNNLVAAMVTEAVQYAEQIFKGQVGKGEEKKAIVTEFLKKYLNEKNIVLSDEQLNTLIESAVYAMNKEAK